MILPLLYALIWALNIHRCDYDWLIILILILIEGCLWSLKNDKPLISIEMNKR